MGRVVDSVVAAAGNAGNLICFDGGQQVGIGIMDGAFFKGARAQMTMQALAVVIGLV